MTELPLPVRVRIDYHQSASDAPDGTLATVQLTELHSELRDASREEVERFALSLTQAVWGAVIRAHESEPDTFQTLAREDTD